MEPHLAAGGGPHLTFLGGAKTPRHTSPAILKITAPNQTCADTHLAPCTVEVKLQASLLLKRLPWHTIALRAKSTASGPTLLSAASPAARPLPCLSSCQLLCKLSPDLSPCQVCSLVAGLIPPPSRFTANPTFSLTPAKTLLLSP